MPLVSSESSSLVGLGITLTSFVYKGRSTKPWTTYHTTEGKNSRSLKVRNVKFILKVQLIVVFSNRGFQSLVPFILLNFIELISIEFIISAC